MSQVNLHNLNSVRLSHWLCVCVRVCQSNATGHKFNLANKHVAIHTNTHTLRGRERAREGAKQLEMCRLCYKNQLQPCAELFGRAIFHAS